MLTEKDVEIQTVRYQNKVFSNKVYFKDGANWCLINNPIKELSNDSDKNSLDNIIQELRRDGFLNQMKGWPFPFTGKIDGREFSLTEKLVLPGAETAEVKVVYQILGGKAYCVAREVTFPGLGLTQYFDDVYDVKREVKHHESPIIQEIFDLANKLMQPNPPVKYAAPSQILKIRQRPLLIVESGVADQSSNYLGIRVLMKGSIRRAERLKIKGKMVNSYRKYEVSNAGGFPLLHWHEIYPTGQQPMGNFETFWLHEESDWIDGHARIYELSSRQYQELLQILPPKEDAILEHLVKRDHEFEELIKQYGAKEIVKFEKRKKFKLDV